MPALDFFPLEDDSIINHANHLSGMTLADFTSEPKAPPAGTSLSRDQQISPSIARSKRTSRASVSTTKSELRQTNSILVGMLQNIQAELASHRAILLNIQNRVSTLESGSESGEHESQAASQATLRVPGGRNAPSQRDSKLAPEIADWWQACQTFARNAEPPMSAREFLHTPQRFSGFDFRWEKPVSPPASPPAVEDLPDLEPTSEGDHSDDDSPTGENVFLGEEMAASIVGSTKDTEVGIRHRTVEFDARKPPSTPILQPAPGAKPVVVDVNDTLVATEPEVVDSSHRFFKGIRSLVTYKAHLKQKNSDKGEHVLSQTMYIVLTKYRAPYPHSFPSTEGH